MVVTLMGGAYTHMEAIMPAYLKAFDLAADRSNS